MTPARERCDNSNEESSYVGSWFWTPRELECAKKSNESDDEVRATQELHHLPTRSKVAAAHFSDRDHADEGSSNQEEDRGDGEDDSPRQHPKTHSCVLLFVTNADTAEYGPQSPR